MEGRKEAFRMYLEQTGTTDALTQVLIKLYDLKDKRPDNEDDALQFMKDNLSNNFPTQADYDKLLAEVEISRKKVEEIQKATEEAEVEKEIKKMKKTAAVTAVNAAAHNMATTTITTIEDAKTRLKELKKHPNCKSLLVQCLTLDMIEKLEKVKADQLLLCIRRGLEDPNILVGIYAAAEDDYVTFKEIFDPIITNYFGSELKTTSTSSWKNATSCDGPLNFRSHLVLRTRITCARSMAKIPFVPQMNNGQLEKLKADVEAELKLLVEDNVKGKYLDAGSMDEKVKAKLEQRHLLFQPENEQLKAAGVNDFSAGRAIFCNDNRNLAVWVNEEEHLKFIATGKDSIKETFIRLRTVVENCEFLAFKTLTENPKPTITFCPTFLGPALHFSVVVKFCNVAARGKIEEIAKKLKICVKPTKKADEFELTNKPKLDKTEFDAMKQFIAEVDDFLKAAHIVTADDALARLEELKKFTPSPESLLVKCLSKDIITALKSSKTKNEKTLLDCIRIGLEDEKLPVGIFAADEECYDQFKDIFEPILKAYYEGVDPDKIEESKWDDGSGNLDNLGFTSELILRTRIACARSVESHSFVPAMNADKLNALKVEVETQLKGTSFQNLCKGTFVALDQLKDSNVIAELKKRQLLFEPENLRLRAAGATDLSTGRAIFYNDEKNLVVWINEEEHLKFIATGTNKNSTHVIRDTFTKLRTVVKQCESLNFMKSKKANATNMDKLGHLTFCPTYLGSTIHVSTVVKFPNVAGRAKVQQMMMKEDEKKLLPFCVEPTTMADEFELTNKPKLDKTEFDAMKQFIAEVDDFLKAAHIVTADDALARLEELKKFTPSPESLLVKCLSKDIITALKSSKTKNEKTLLDCIRIGLEHEKLPLGIFAADEECYGQFKDIFEPILKAYYEGVDPDKIEESKWDDGSGNLDNLGFTSELILRTRITCARSVESHSFVPAMNADKLNALKVEVETQLKGTSFQNLCKGTFVALDQLKDSNVIAELKKRQLLFEPENVRLRAAGVTDFSQGRAIFYNDDNNLVVWINEEEHLKFIATRTNDPTKSAPIIKEAFTDLSTAVTKIGLSFEKSESTFWLNECNLTLCPTFLGPAIHVSAVVKLAKAAARGKVEYFAKELKICVKPTTVADEFEVTNKPNLNKTEYDAIKEFVDKLEKLVGRETKLITTIDEAWKRWGEVVSVNADSEISKSKPTDEKELEAEDQKGKTSNGKTLLDCIRPGLEDDKMGIYAVDADAYDKFAVLFEKYVKAIHGSPPFPQTVDDGWTGDSSKFLHSDYSSYAKSSRITCRRSFKDFPFIPAMTTTQLRALRATVKAKLEEYDDKGKFYDLAGIDDQTKNELINGGHWFEPVNERLRSVGVKDFTTGRAVFVSKENNLTVWLCEEDHLKFISTAADGDIAKTFEQLKGAVDKFKQVEFHKHNDWGWKTFCPKNLGSTIEATIVLNLPNIAKADAGFSGTFEDYCNTETIQLVGAKVCALPKAANTTSTEYAISNDKKFGKEFDLIMAVYEAAKALAKQETTL